MEPPFSQQRLAGGRWAGAASFSAQTKQEKGARARLLRGTHPRRLRSSPGRVWTQRPSSGLLLSGCGAGLAARTSIPGPQSPIPNPRTPRVGKARELERGGTRIVDKRSCKPPCPAAPSKPWLAIGARLQGGGSRLGCPSRPRFPPLLPGPFSIVSKAPSGCSARSRAPRSPRSRLVPSGQNRREPGDKWGTPGVTHRVRLAGMPVTCRSR